jgi:hypothetical protein
METGKGKRDICDDIFYLYFQKQKIAQRYLVRHSATAVAGALEVLHLLG